MGNKLHKQSFHILSIGYVRRKEKEISLEVHEQYRPALKQLEHFSHVNVLWWAHKHDNERSRNALQCEPPYAQGIVTGVFATRAEYRPNPIAVTTCEILKIDETKGTVTVKNIDAFDGTPVVDLKAYFAVCDRVRNARIPEWLSDWPEWMPEEGLGL